MKGLDTKQAIAHVLANLDTKAYKQLADHGLEGILAYFLQEDLAFMHEKGVLTAQGDPGPAYYDDDDAFEHILEKACEHFQMEDAQAELALAALLDDYMELFESYMEEKGLVDWDKG